MPSYTLCSCCGKGKEDAGKVMDGTWVAAVAHLDIDPGAISLQSWANGQADMSTCSSPISPACFGKQGSLWGHAAWVPLVPFPSCFELTAMSNIESRAGAVGKWPQQPNWAAWLLPSKPTLPFLTLFLPSPNLSSLPQKPFVTSLFPNSCASHHCLFLPGLLPFPHNFWLFVQPSIRICPWPPRHSISSAQLYFHQLPGCNFGLRCCEGL